MKTREQHYAAQTYNQVYELFAQDKTYRDAYGSMAHRLPVLVRQAGLVQALAFVEARGKPAHKQLLEHLAEVVLDGGAKTDLLARSRNDAMMAYMHLTENVLAALAWYKRFAQSILDVDPTAEGDEGS